MIRLLPKKVAYRQVHCADLEGAQGYHQLGQISGRGRKTVSTADFCVGLRDTLYHLKAGY